MLLRAQGFSASASVIGRLLAECGQAAPRAKQAARPRSQSTTAIA
jgi:hypothetical protein